MVKFWPADLRKSMFASKVLVFKTSPRTLKDDVRRTLKEAGLAEHYSVEMKTLIKINANYDRFYPGCNTSTWFLEALFFAMKELGFVELAVVESDLKLQPADKTIEVIGVKDLCEKHKIPFINLSKEKCDGELPLLLYESQIVNVPVVHTHTFAVVSCACKNLFGLLPADREKYHNVLSEKLLELYTRIRPCFTIVDGTVGLDGGSMRMGNHKRLDLIIAGWDPLAIDVVISKMMGFSVRDVPLLKLAKERGLLTNPHIYGDFNDLDTLPNFGFTYKESKLAKLDLWLRRNRFTKDLFRYNSVFDKTAHYLRRKYLSIHYSLRKKKILNGDWMEYARLPVAQDKYEGSSSYRN
jgi:uncharacterized protein (DUF362 family)